MTQLAEYIRTHYGRCAAPPPCRCLQLGVWYACPHWRGIKSQTWQELIEIVHGTQSSS